MPCKLIPSYKDYAWGDLRFIQELTGLTTQVGRPVAEMWLGAHPGAPAQVVRDGQTLALNTLIASNPQHYLGEAKSLFAGQLPFLFKVLAAAQPLSIQVHPSLEAARTGYYAENQAGLRPDDPLRNFRDDNHKPELICALTPFDMLCGIRPYDELVQDLNALGLEQAGTLWAQYMHKPDASGMKCLFAELLTYPATEINNLVDRIITHTNAGSSKLKQHLELIIKLNDHNPGDAGVLASLFMNLLTLYPGEAVFLDAGIPHAYLNGAGLELMANSDNVIRGGLTGKHVDPLTFVQHTSFTGAFPHIYPAPSLNLNQPCCYPTNSREFKLCTINLGGTAEMDTHNQAQILLCIKGECILNDSLRLGQGEAAWVDAAEGRYSLSGQGLLALSTTNC